MIVSNAVNSPTTASDETPKLRAEFAALSAINMPVLADKVDTSSGFCVRADKLVDHALTVCGSGFSRNTNAPNPPISCPLSA